MIPLLVFLVALAWYLYRLTGFPIFADEAIYLHWAKRIAMGYENIFISMFDGKPPLFMWLSAVGSLVQPHIFLVGRLVSVASLFIAVTIIYRSLKKTSPSWGWGATVFILASPFIFFSFPLSLIGCFTVKLIGFSCFDLVKFKLKF